MVLACLIASVGIFLGSPILIVGAMVVGPEFGPLAGLCVAVVERRRGVALRSLTALAVGFPVGITAAFLFTLICVATGLRRRELQERRQPADPVHRRARRVLLHRRRLRRRGRHALADLGQVRGAGRRADLGDDDPRRGQHRRRGGARQTGPTGAGRWPSSRSTWLRSSSPASSPLADRAPASSRQAPAAPPARSARSRRARRRPRRAWVDRSDAEASARARRAAPRPPAGRAGRHLEVLGGAPRAIRTLPPRALDQHRSSVARHRSSRRRRRASLEPRSRAATTSRMVCAAHSASGRECACTRRAPTCLIVSVTGVAAIAPAASAVGLERRDHAPRSASAVTSGRAASWIATSSVSTASAGRSTTDSSAGPRRRRRHVEVVTRRGRGSCPGGRRRRSRAPSSAARKAAIDHSTIGLPASGTKAFGPPAPSLARSRRPR